MNTPQNNVPNSQAFTLKPVGFFPGLGSRSAYHTLECDLSLSDAPDIRDAYTQGAAALGLEAKQIVLTPANLPEDRIERQAFLSAALLVHGIVLQRHLDSEAARAGTQIRFAAFTGESFGIITAAVAANALSIADGTKLAYALAPFILVGAEGAQGLSPLQARIASVLAQSGVMQPLVAEPAHVVGLSGRPDALQNALATLKDTYSAQDVELHKVYADHQVNLYVRMGIRESFGLFIANFPELSLQELKEPTAFMAHAARMAPVREAFACMMDEEGIKFRDAHTPLICNHEAAIVQGAADIREAVLAVIDRVMQSRWTAERCEHVGANLVLELGQGDKSIHLLNDNGLTLPAIGYAGALHATEAFVEAARLLQAFGETARSNIQSRDLTPDALALLRQMFQVPARYPEIAKFLRREFAKTIAASQIDRRHSLAPMSRRFIEVYQYSIAVAGDLDLDAGELALQVQAKKKVVGDSHTLGRVNTEIKVLRIDGTIVHRISNARWSPEVLVFYCSRLENRPAVELIHAGRRMAEHTPKIATLYRASLAFLSFDLTDTLQMPSGMLQPRAIAALQILYQLAMLTLLRRERPAIFTSHNYYVGGDLLGWCVALAATSALSARDAVALYTTHLEKTDVADPVDTILDRLRESTAPIVAASGVPLITIKDIARETRALFSHAAFDTRRHNLRLNGDVQIVCLASSPAHKTFDTTPFGSEVTLIATPADIARRGHNTALEALEHGCMSSLTGDNQRVLQFAQERKILSSTVFSYIKLGEQVVGFGKGGSESMTIFVTRKTIMPLDTSKPIIVRKILSEALIAVGWNSDGEGVMLPPFVKAKRQAEFLKALSDPARQYFPEVFEILEREIPVPPYQRQDMQRDSFKELIYEMSFVPGEEVSRYVERCSPPPAIVARIYEQIALVLARDVHSLRRAPAPGQTLETSYFHKIEARLALCRRTAPLTCGPNLLDTDHIVINGVQYRNVGTLLKAFREHPAYCEILEPRFHALVMGDTNTENIKINNLGPLQYAQTLIESGAAQSEIDAALDAITAISIDLRFFDPRAIGFASEGAETRNDPMYDNKPWHNSLGHYDEMHYERFELAVRTGPNQTPNIQITYEPNNPYARAYCVEDLTERGIDIASQPGGMGIEYYFAPVMRKLYDVDNPNSPPIAEDPHWLVRFVFIMGTHFTAMPPFHFQTELGGALIDSLLVQRRPVAIFCEGIRWLNWALQMLEGTRHSFLGIEVPAASVPHQPRYGTGLPDQGSRQMAISPNPAFSRIGMAAMAPESRVICTPWSRMVRGLALGQYPVGYDDAITGIVTQARDILTQQVTKPTGYLRFALQLAELGIALNRPGARVTQDELQTRATGLMNALRTETNPYYAAVGGGILFDAFAKFRLDIFLLVNSTRDFAAEMLDAIDRIQPDQIKDENAGNHGEYEKLFAYTSIFLGIGQAGLTNRLTSGPRNYVREALHLIQTVPSPFFKGRGCSMLFSVLSAIGLDGMIFDDGHDFMKEVLEHVDRDDSVDFPLRFPQPITRAYVKIYPRITMLNAIAISGRHEYASMGHDRVAELKLLWAELEPAEKMHQSLYYLIALHNLGRTEQEIGSVHVLMDELLGYLDVVDPGANFFLNGLSHAYIVESAMLTGRLGDIPPQEIDRIAGCLKRMDATPIDRASRAYPFSYNLNALGEIGEAGALMSPNPVYGGVSAFSWLVGQFSPDGQTEGSRLLMLGNALMGLSLRLRPKEHLSTPMFNDFARRRGWKIEA